MIGFKLTNLVFDGQLIIDKADKAAMRALRVIGFQTQQHAVNSMKNSDVPSAPGTPPNVHVGTLKRFTIYQIDKEAKSVVIGPKYLKKRSRDAASSLEHGGTSINSKGKPIRIAKRPFMVPAFDSIKRQQVPAVFENSLY